VAFCVGGLIVTCECVLVVAGFLGSLFWRVCLFWERVCLYVVVCFSGLCVCLWVCVRCEVIDAVVQCVGT